MVFWDAERYAVTFPDKDVIEAVTVVRLIWVETCPLGGCGRVATGLDAVGFKETELVIFGVLFWVFLVTSRINACCE